MSAKTKVNNHPGHAGNVGIETANEQQCGAEWRKNSEEEHTRLTQVRAYHLWERAGRPDGDAAREQFWSDAEKEIAACATSE